MVTARVTAVNTVALAARTVRRWGTAEKVVRIMPLAYSLVMTMTPRTAMASWARIPPMRLNDAGSKPAFSCGERWAYCAAKTAHTRADSPMVVAAVISSVQ